MLKTGTRFLAVALAVMLLAAACGEDTSEEVVETTTAATEAPIAEESETPAAEEEPQALGTIVEVAVESGAFPGPVKSSV